MRRLALALGFLLLLPAYLVAQDKPAAEIGTRIGVDILLPDDGSLVSVGIPGGGPSPAGSLLGTSSTIHFAFFPSTQVMVEPQVSFSLLSISNGGSETLTSFGLSGMVAFLFNGAAVNSPYVGANATFFLIDGDGDSENDFALGGSVGYRLLPMEHIAVRLEGSYRRWLDFEFNEITVAAIFAVVL